MRLSSKVLVSVLSLLAITTGGSAFAENLFSFAYSDLDGDYDAASMLFTAADDDNTNGDVTRIISPGSTAFFSGNAGDGGFVFERDPENLHSGGTLRHRRNAAGQRRQRHHGSLR